MNESAVSIDGTTCKTDGNMRWSDETTWSKQQTSGKSVLARRKEFCLVLLSNNDTR